ncbi:MAG: glycerophosphodiester phosphodiesterase family protein [Bacteroidales bacterium]|jgi:glycerophosphoryl diester phosphodiesterase|nr:glycerophosphodiester phosphodiesterase family protein [Bacteroidota bacterium]NLO00325.1 glycerophosphodiester phosphodiesterase family protein [Bacteroidales bacterium]
MKRFLLALMSILIVLSICPAYAQKHANKAEWVAGQLHNPNSRYVLVAAHRGDWRNWPENSLPAIQSAIEMGADIVELDIHRSKDGILMVCHDATIDRTTTGKGKISDLTCQEIKEYWLRAGHGVKTEIKMPTLKEALELCKDRIIVNIDKGYDYYDEIISLTDSLGVTEQVLLKGKNPKAEVDDKFAARPRNMMYLPISNIWEEKGMDLLESYLSAQDKPIAYEICWNTDTQKECEQVTERLKEARVKIYINSLWPSLNGGYCDDAAYFDPDKYYGKLLEMGATIIQSDRPALLIKWLHKKRRHKAPGK